MAHELRCLSCAHENEPGASVCAACNYPLRDGAPAPAPAASATSAPVHEAAAETSSATPAEQPRIYREPVAPAPPPAISAPAAKPAVEIRRVRPIRPRRPADPQQKLQTQLIVVLGGMAVVIAILSVAWQGYRKNNGPAQAQVPGATAQQLADMALATNQIQADSTNVNAQIALANTLYDTANWSEAILHYRTALRLDPSRVTTIVDLGVCYYSLSDMASAEELFTRALLLDPRQPVALFNMGIVSEAKGESEKAVQYFKKALQSNPPEGMRAGLEESIQRVQAKVGKQPPAAASGF